MTAVSARPPELLSLKPHAYVIAPSRSRFA
jgi:hypothetical protein